MTPTHRKCPDCRVDKPSSEYYRDSNRLSRLDFYCKNCSKARRRKSQAYKDTHNRWAKENRIKANAHNAVLRAIKNNRLTKPADCENCGVEAKLNAHHSDYCQPLEVQWICTDCHYKVHHPVEVVA